MAPTGSRADPREREVGVVLSITPTGRLTLRAPGSRAAPEGTVVLDRQGKEVGRVARVFGPVSRPFLSVRPRGPLRAPDAARLIGATLRRG